MDLNVRQITGVKVIELVGEPNLQTSSDMCETIANHIHLGDCVTFDMCDVTHIFNVGVRKLLLLYRSLANGGSSVCLVGLPENLQDMLSITGFWGFFNTCSTIDMGIQSVLRPTGYKVAA